MVCGRLLLVGGHLLVVCCRLLIVCVDLWLLVVGLWSFDDGLLSFVLIYCSEAATRGVLYRRAFLEISQNSQKNTCARISFLIKLQASGFIEHL